MNTTLNILLVDDHPIFTEGLKLLLSTHSEFKVIGTCANGIEMLDFLNTHKPDIALVDINMPILNGEDAIVQAMEIHPDLRIIVLTSEDRSPIVERILVSGVKGLISKTSCQTELVEAINTVHMGGIHFSQDIFDRLVAAMKRPDKAPKKLMANFTDREKEIIKLLCEGKTSKEIAVDLDINHRTVETHKSNILEKAGVKNTISLVVFAIKNNLLD